MKHPKKLLSNYTRLIKLDCNLEIPITEAKR